MCFYTARRPTYESECYHTSRITLGYPSPPLWSPNPRRPLSLPLRVSYLHGPRSSAWAHKQPRPSTAPRLLDNNKIFQRSPLGLYTGHAIESRPSFSEMETWPDLDGPILVFTMKKTGRSLTERRGSVCPCLEHVRALILRVLRGSFRRTSTTAMNNSSFSVVPRLSKRALGKISGRSRRRRGKPRWCVGRREDHAMAEDEEDPRWGGGRRRPCRASLSFSGYRLERKDPLL